MKRIVSPVVAAISLAIASHASALDFHELEGTWKGIRTETRGGLGTYTTAKLTAAKKSDGSLAISETGSSKTFGSYTVKHTFSPGGKYRAQLIGSGHILATSTGKWKKANESIYIAGTVLDASGSASFSGAIQRVSATKIVYTGKSGGISVKISGSK